jgi:hypothetical protein
MLVYFNLYAESEVTLCMSGKIELMLPSYKDAILNSVELALNQNSLGKNIKIKTYFYDNKPLSPIEAYHEMIHETRLLSRASVYLGQDQNNLNKQNVNQIIV